MKRDLIYIGILFVLIQACVETTPVSTTPEITFKSFNLFLGEDSLQNVKLIGALNFSFIDGDADLGMYIDTTLPDSLRYNVFLLPFEKIDSTYIPIDLDTSGNKPPPFYTIQRNIKLERVGQNKTVKGNITINIEYEILPPYDTIRYDFYIRDRKGHKSNIESTSDIGFKGITLPNTF